jgi:hypothetical protein
MGNNTLAHFLNKVFRALFICLIFISAGCNNSDNENELAQSLVIDPVFQVYYDTLGGKQVLGAVISPAFVIQNIKYQYTVGALLENDPLAQGDQKVKLSPIGKDLKIDEHIEFVEGQISGLFLRDYIYPEFLQVYQYLGGMQVVGRPLTGLHYNPELQRYEQYFENLGFYRLEKDTPGTVYLLAYGAWKCGEKCPAIQKVEATVVVQNNIDSIFVAGVKQLGYGFTGFALKPGYQAEDGGYEQIFENVLLRVDMSQPGKITLAPLSKKLTLNSDPLETPGQDGSTQFIRIDGDKGFNVLKEFIDYLNNHGGLELAGNPIGKLKPYKNSLSRQCFENLCLEIDTSITGIYRVRPVPLGYSYIQLLNKDLQGEKTQPATETPQSETTPPIPQSTLGKEMSVQVWENNPFVTSSQTQVIGVMVYGNNQPLANMTPALTITLPDGSHKEYFMPETDENGKSQIQLEPTGAPNGTLIPYQVCVSKTLEEEFCVQDNFLIWNNP